MKLAVAEGFWERDGADLSPALREAVAHVQGPLLVVAGPGSGKTTVITHRVAYLVEVAGISPASLLVVTFTRAAADEMKTRAAALAGGRAGAATFGTIHALAYRILKEARGKAPSLLDEDAGLRLVRGVMRGLGLNTDEDAVLEMAGEISAAKSGGGPAAPRARGTATAVFERVLQGYEAEKERLGKLDFDDLLLECRRLLREREAVLAACRRRWSHVMVDEFQDTNPVQYDILRLISAPLGNFCVVGDDDQSVYGWRGATPRALLDFAAAYPGCRRVSLTVNYRSTGRILAAAAACIAPGTGRFAKELTTPRPAGSLPELWRPADSLQEAQRVLELVRRHVAVGGSPADVGVIYRTNQQAHVLSQVLERESVPYRALGGVPNLFRRWPVQDVLAYLHLAAGQGTWELVEQVINRPNRFVSRQVLAAARQIHAERGYPPLAAIGATGLLPFWHVQRLDELTVHLERVAALTAPEAIAYVRSVIGYDDYLVEYHSRAGGSPAEAQGLLAEVQRAAPGAAVPAFLAAVDARSAGSEWGSARPGEPAVTLSTCHKAKGLEFPLVVVCGAVDGLMPHRSNLNIDEERRLCYVAMTRARDGLAISCPQQVEGRTASPSSFVLDAIAHLAPTATDAPAPAPEPPVRAVPKPTPPTPPTPPGRSGGAGRTRAAEPAGRYAAGGVSTRVRPQPPADSAPQPPPLRVGSSVWHRRWGEGSVECLDEDGTKVTINFEGRRVSLDVRWCLRSPGSFRVVGAE